VTSGFRGPPLRCRFHKSLPDRIPPYLGSGLRRGFTGLSALLQTKLEQSPFSGQVFVFRGRRGDLIKLLRYDGDGLCLFAKRLGAWAFCVAASGERNGFADASAAVDVAGRHRLAAAGADLGAAVIGVTEEILATTFFCREQRRTRAFVRYSAHARERTAGPTFLSRPCVGCWSRPRFSYSLPMSFRTLRQSNLRTL
jgi:hypothetical protein